MDIRDIQALHAQYSSQPVVIDINSHVRALPAPHRPGLARDRLTTRLVSSGRKLGRPAAIVVALAAGAALTGICAARLWHALNPPQAVADVAGATRPSPVTALAAISHSAPTGPQRQLTSGDFADLAERTPNGTHPQGAGTQQPPEAGQSAARASNARPNTFHEKGAPSSPPADSAASSAAAGQQQPATAEQAPSAVPATSSAPAAEQPSVRSAEQPKGNQHRGHRAVARQRQETAVNETTASTLRVESPSKSPTPAKAGDVPLF